MKVFRGAICLFVFFFSACGFFNQAEEERSFVVVDRDSNKIISAYYTDQNDRILRTETYGDDQFIVRSQSFSYDNDGFIRSIEEWMPGRAKRTQIITIQTTKEFDIEGRLIKLVQLRSDGQVFESFFAYDETGRLRGTVVQTDGDAVIMRDYIHE